MAMMTARVHLSIAVLERCACVWVGNYSHFYFHLDVSLLLITWKMQAANVCTLFLADVMCVGIDMGWFVK